MATTVVDGRSALHFAAQVGLRVVVKKLLERSAVNAEEAQAKEAAVESTEGKNIESPASLTTASSEMKTTTHPTHPTYWKSTLSTGTTASARLITLSYLNLPWSKYFSQWVQIPVIQSWFWPS